MARATRARAISTLNAVPGKRRGPVELVRRGEEPRDRRGAGERDPRLAADLCRGDADERERPAPAVHRLAGRCSPRPPAAPARGSAHPARASSSSGRPPTVGRARRCRARGGRCAGGRRARAAPRPGRTDERRRRSRSRRTRARGAASRAWQLSPRAAGTETAAASTSSVAWSRLPPIVPMFRSCGDAARRHASRSASGSSVDASSSASVVPAPIVRPEIPRGTASRTSTRLSAERIPSKQRHHLGPAREGDRAVRQRRHRGVDGLRPRQLQQAPSAARRPRGARAGSPRA